MATPINGILREEVTKATQRLAELVKDGYANEQGYEVKMGLREAGLGFQFADIVTDIVVAGKEQVRA